MSNGFNNPDIYQTTGSRDVPPTLPVHTAPQSPPINIICPPPRTNWFARLFFMMFSFVVFFGCLFAAMVIFTVLLSMVINESEALGEKHLSGNVQAKDKIVVLRVDGLIMGGDESFINRQIKSIADDGDIKAIVLRIDSPGGTISGSDEYLHRLKKLKSDRNIPIIVSMGSLAASGGYYVAMCGDIIYAEPTTTTGSIGVIVPHYDMSSLFEKIGVSSDPIVTGPFKTMGSMSKPMKTEERELWQSYVNESFERFKEIIRDNRQAFAEEPEKLNKLATGQIYSAVQAKENGLIDSIGFLEDAIEDAKARAALTDYKVVRYKKSSTFMETLLSESDAHSSVQTQRAIKSTISDITTPRGYYLMPGVLPVQVRE
ncbi:MAG: signal peptide peptidase SppA [Planctomycetaceae bacterium]|jgi:protease-4|nr:signal peptide peptidase SppA [Planctomycetaceae bacterium]